jgi:hypothetical protein
MQILRRIATALAVASMLTLSTVVLWGASNCEYCGERTETISAGSCNGFDCTYPHCKSTTMNKTCNYDHGDPGIWINCTQAGEPDCRKFFWDCVTSSNTCS